MRFSELVKCTPWLEVEVSFLDYYGVHSEKFKKRIRKKKIKKFQDIYVKLNNIVPVETNWRIVVSKYIEENEVGTAIFDDELSSAQERNISKILQCKVLDLSLIHI